jgi:hypothetical protein
VLLANLLVGALRVLPSRRRCNGPGVERRIPGRYSMDHTSCCCCIHGWVVYACALLASRRSTLPAPMPAPTDGPATAAAAPTPGLPVAGPCVCTTKLQASGFLFKDTVEVNALDDPEGVWAVTVLTLVIRTQTKRGVSAPAQQRPLSQQGVLPQLPTVVRWRAETGRGCCCHHACDMLV